MAERLIPTRSTRPDLPLTRPAPWDCPACGESEEDCRCVAGERPTWPPARRPEDHEEFGGPIDGD